MTPQLLDDAICNFLKTQHGHPTNSDLLVEMAGGKWRRIDARMQAMRKAGRIMKHRGPSKLWPHHVKPHGWEVLT